MDVKATFIGNYHRTILDSCEFGENKALKVFSSVLENKSNELTAEQVKIVLQQQTTLRADHDRVKALINSTA